MIQFRKVKFLIEVKHLFDKCYIDVLILICVKTCPNKKKSENVTLIGVYSLICSMFSWKQKTNSVWWVVKIRCYTYMMNVSSVCLYMQVDFYLSLKKIFHSYRDTLLVRFSKWDLCSALVDKEQRELLKRATPSLTRSSVFKVINMDQWHSHPLPSYWNGRCLFRIKYI